MCLNEYILAGCKDFKSKIYILVPPEITIQSSITRFSSQILLNCMIIARPLASAKWKRNRIEIKNNIKRIEINDYTIELILILQVNFQIINFSKKKTNFILKIDLLNYTNIFGLYECEAENQLKVTKSFIIIDGKIIFSKT
jgi:hypothetical protein